MENPEAPNLFRVITQLQPRHFTDYIATFANAASSLSSVGTTVELVGTTVELVATADCCDLTPIARTDFATACCTVDTVPIHPQVVLNTANFAILADNATAADLHILDTAMRPQGAVASIGQVAETVADTAETAAASMADKVQNFDHCLRHHQC